MVKMIAKPYNHYATFRVREVPKLIYRDIDNDKSFSVTKREENTRSHPEHGRKDLLRRKYLEGHLLEK